MEILYLAGKISGDPDYREKFRRAAESLDGIVLNPAALPEELPAQRAMEICMAMLDAADRAVFLPDSADSAGAMLEMQYCRYVKKPITILAELPKPEDAAQDEKEAAPESPTEPLEAAEELEQARSEEKEDKLYSGFLFLRCPRCGSVKAFCTKIPSGEYTCRECGAVTPLRKLTRAYTKCKCGYHAKYQVNLTDWCFDIPCVQCGSPCAVEYSPAKDIYVPMESKGARKTRSPKKK